MEITNLNRTSFLICCEWVRSLTSAKQTDRSSKDQLQGGVSHSAENGQVTKGEETTVIPIDAASIIDVQTDSVEGDSFVVRIHQGVRLLRVLQTQCVADFVSQHIGEETLSTANATI